MLGKDAENVFGCGGRGDVGGVGKCWERCEKVCWGVREVRREVGKGVRKC